MPHEQGRYVINGKMFVQSLAILVWHTLHTHTTQSQDPKTPKRCQDTKEAKFMPQTIGWCPVHTKEVLDSDYNGVLSTGLPKFGCVLCDILLHYAMHIYTPNINIKRITKERNKKKINKS